MNSKARCLVLTDPGKEERGRYTLASYVLTDSVPVSSSVVGVDEADVLEWVGGQEVPLELWGGAFPGIEGDAVGAGEPMDVEWESPLRR